MIYINLPNFFDTERYSQTNHLTSNKNTITILNLKTDRYFEFKLRMMHFHDFKFKLRSRF